MTPRSLPHRERVPITRLDNADPALLAELLETVSDVATAGAFTLGKELEAFERAFATYTGTAYVVGVSSGTDAIALALRALRIGPGDEVIVPANSFIATAEAVALVGATPVLVDVDPGSQLITAEGVERRLTPRTRCVIPVHLYGATVDLDPILELARSADVAVVEDAAQAHGARHRRRRVGSVGTLGCFSFYPTKNLGGWGDGGAVVTNDEELADHVRLLRSHGERSRHRHLVQGTTARLDNLQAAILRRKLVHLERWNDRRRQLGTLMRSELTGASVELPAPAFAGADHVYHLFVVRSPTRDALREHLDRRGVASAVHYPVPIHRTEAFAHLGVQRGALPAAERLAERICSLPLWPGMSDPEAHRVIQAVRDFRPRRARGVRERRGEAWKPIPS